MKVRALGWGQRGESAPPWVMGVAALNGLAFNAHQTWAFWRSELSPWTESPFLCDNGERATMALVRTLPLRMFGVERLLLMAKEAGAELADTLRRLPIGARVATHLGISERFAVGAAPEFQRQAKVLQKGLEAWAQTLGVGAVTLHPQGHAALAHALLEAGAALNARTVDAVVVGGLETYYDPAVVEQLDAQRRLTDGENPHAMIPGEGVAFLVLTRPEVGRQMKATPLAQLEVVATGHEEHPLLGEEPCDARGLSDTLRAVTTRLKAARRMLEWAVMDVTAEEYRTQEFAMALPRSVAPGGLDTAGKDFFQLTDARFVYDFVPECFGDLGGASMATGAVLASRSFLHGAPVRSNCVVSGSAVNHARGCILLSAVPARD